MRRNAEGNVFLPSGNGFLPSAKRGGYRGVSVLPLATLWVERVLRAAKLFLKCRMKEPGQRIQAETGKFQVDTSKTFVS